MPVKNSASTSHVRVHAVDAPERLGGETRPYEYPHLYQIQAGDWRISYAVERNRLAILVLEVLNADGSAAPDPVRDTLTRKMKIKLLDWPEGSPSRDLPPEELGKKIKIKLLDMTEEDEPEASAVIRPSRVRLAHTKSQRSRLAIRLDPPSEAAAATYDRTDPAEVVDATERKVTPLDSPTM